MLRTLLFTLALGGIAAAEEFPQSAVGIDVRADDGTVIGQVDAIERDAHGRIVAAEIAGLEPADAPRAPRDLVAEQDDPRWLTVSDRDEADRLAAGGGRAVSR